MNVLNRIFRGLAGGFALATVMALVGGQSPVLSSPDASQPMPTESWGEGDAMVQVLADGTVRFGIWPVRTQPGGKEIRSVWRFGLPPVPPSDVRWEAPGVPVRVTTRESEEIRYTQSVLLAAHPVVPPENGDFPTTTRVCRVLLVRIEGLNTAGEYTDARVHFELWVEGRRQPLELEHGILYALSNDRRMVVGGIDVPSEGIADARGETLRFHGHMPPGLSGHMTFKLLSFPLETPAERELDALRDLDFDFERRRVGGR